MNSNPITAQTFIDAAMQALRRGDRRAAYRFAEQAAALAPQTEQPWLLLAYLASPAAALYYLDRALQVNPSSKRALAAQAWLKTLSVHGAQIADSSSAAPFVRAQPAQPAPARRRSLRRPVGLAGLVALVLLAGLVIVAAVGAARPPASQDPALVRALQTLTAMSAGSKQASSPIPSLTHTALPTSTTTSDPTATLTASPLPTQTASSSPSPTALPPTATASPQPTSTQTAKPTKTQPPAPTAVKNINYTVKSGDTLNLIAMRYNVTLQDLISANNIFNPSVIMAGQVLVIPNKGGSSSGGSQPTPVSNPPGASGKGKEIQIDISEQHIYAYQDGKLVFSFVASTGIGNSTRIGTFKVLDKIPNAYSNAFNIWMPWWMGIYYSGTLENGIHGLPRLWNGVELWGNLLGKPATYGCIESRTSEIKQLYDWAEIGTPVIIRR